MINLTLFGVLSFFSLIVLLILSKLTLVQVNRMEVFYLVLLSLVFPIFGWIYFIYLYKKSR